MNSPIVSRGHKLATRALGVTFAALAAVMTFKAGYPLGGDDPAACWLLGIGLGAVTIAVALLLHHIDNAIQAKNWGWALGLAAFWTACVITEYGSHVMFTVGHRAMNETTATVQDAVYTDARQSVKDNEQLVATFRKNLDDLTAKNGWLATVTADGLRASLDSAQKAIDLEAARHGCKEKCLARMQEKADLSAKIAIAEQKQDLSNRIAATQSILDKARAQSATLRPGDSIVSNQAEVFASFASLSLHPGEDAKGWASRGYGALISLVFSFAGGILLAVSAKQWMGFALPGMPGHRHGHDARAAAPFPNSVYNGDPPNPSSPAPGAATGTRMHSLWQMSEGVTEAAAPVAAPFVFVPAPTMPRVVPASPAPKAQPLAAGPAPSPTVVEKYFDNNGLTREAIANALQRQGLMARAA